MYKVKNVQKISILSGRSKATVSRVLNHRPGVSVETREEILRVAAQFEMEQPAARACEVSVLAPDNPKFFWSRIPSVVKACAPQWSAGVHIYTSLSRSAGMDESIRRALRGGCRVMILAALPDAALRRQLEALARDVLLIQLCEYAPVAGSVYVGSDLYGDGRALALAVREKLRGRRCIALRPAGQAGEQRRLEGFTHALGETAFTYIDEEPMQGKLYSANLARRLSREGAFDYLFCPSGNTAKACEGLLKLRLPQAPQCIGFETSPTVEAYFRRGCIAAMAVQDIEGQTRAALSLARRYLETGLRPEREQQTIPSQIRVWRA